jgi:hypothetical protein
MSSILFCIRSQVLFSISVGYFHLRRSAKQCKGFTSFILTLAGHSGGAPAADYSVVGTPASKFYGVFNSLAIIITTYGNSIIPEIQVTSKQTQKILPFSI